MATVKKAFNRFQNFDIACSNGRKDVVGKLLKMDEFPDELFFVHFDNTILLLPEWTVSHLETGLKVGSGITRNSAISFAKDRMIRHKDKWGGIKMDGLKILEDFRISYPLNQIQ